MIASGTIDEGVTVNYELYITRDPLPLSSVEWLVGFG